MNKQFGRNGYGRWCVALLWPLLMLGLFSSWVQAATDYLEPDAAFQFSAKMLDKNTIAVKYLIADGYYLYREPFRFQVNGAKLGTPSIPAGHIKFDNTF
ncbi:MAG: protein-disulfide reductase DsbD N-terminal domain-containing protein, partial [Herbaspirillum sp.]